MDAPIVVFQSKNIRRLWRDQQWYFSVVDVIATLTDSPTPRQYWGKVKEREFISMQLSPIWAQLKLPSADGKSYETDCVNTERAFSVIQSISSPKAEFSNFAVAEKKEKYGLGEEHG